jgi:hypothetical protein
MPKNYYRLKITDANGEQSYSQIRNVNFDRFSDVVVYPNPIVTGGILNLQIDADINGIQLYNALGQAVYSLNSNTKQIEIPSYLSAGIYTLVIELEGSQYIRKLVVE